MSARPRLLIVKTSSLGDVVHALPIVSDVIASDSDSVIDWVCEDTFADIPALHPGVRAVIPCAMRRWRRTWWTVQGRQEMAEFRRAVARTAYDVVLDTQGLLKSAWIACQAPGVRHGYSWSSATEPLATLAYHRRHPVPWGQHAIARNRQLASAALGHAVEGAPRYQVQTTFRPAAAPYAVVLHATSRDDKQWPEANWRSLLKAVSQRDLRIVLPWGSASERARSERLAAGIRGAEVPLRMGAKVLADLFGSAQWVIGVDTGLVHLAAAAGAPTLALFVATDPILTGVIGEHASAINLGGAGKTPDVAQVLAVLEGLYAGAPRRLFAR